jgi:hypothetical protein
MKRKKPPQERNDDMDIEWTMDEAADVHGTRPEEYDIVPVGTHRLKIVSAEVGPNQWKVDEKTNPDGICLKIRLELDATHKHIYHDLPKHRPYMGAELAKAIGLEAEGNTLRVSPEAVLGQVVIAMVEHYTSKAGKVSAVIKKYLPGPVQPQAAKPARTPAAKVRAASPAIGSDDIPFAWLVALIASVIGGAA